MRVAEYIIEVLQTIGTQHMFGVPGGAIEPMFDACANSQRRGGIKCVLTRSEAGAAFAADGYYRESKNPALVVSTTGPGATNLITGLASAKTERIPVMVITAQTDLSKFGRTALQESSDCGIDTVAIFSHVTQFSTAVTHVDQVIPKLATAINTMFGVVPGPVHLSIPTDILRAEMPVKSKLLSFDRNKSFASAISRLGDSVAPDITNRINSADRPVFYFGEFTEDDAEALAALAARCNIPYVVGSASKGWFATADDRNYGVYGFAGHETASKLLLEADRIIALGTSFQEMSSCNWNDLLLNDKLMHLCGSPDEMVMTSTCEQFICSTRQFIEACVNTIDRREDIWPLYEPETFMSTDDASTPEGTKIDPLELMPALANVLPLKSRVYLDAGNTWAWAINRLPVDDNVSKHRIAMTYGSMSWAISAAIGAAIACTDRITCITGDGSWLMSSNELSTAVAKRLPIIYIILNDSQLGMVKHGQRKNGAESIANELPKTSFSAMALAQGAHATTIGHTSQLHFISKLAHHALEDRMPLVVEIIIDPEVVPPMGVRCDSLQTHK